MNVPNGKLRVTQELCGSGELWLAGGEPLCGRCHPQPRGPPMA